MAKTLYCWRCKIEVPMLEEHEWQQLAPDLTDAVADIKNYRATHEAPLAPATNQGYGQAALERYFQLTGVRETKVDVLRHHRLALFGPPCCSCGKPLRTPRAKVCAECGVPVGN